MPLLTIPTPGAVLWDLDGVLVDTAEQHYQAFLTVFAEIGVPLERETFMKTFGMNNASIFRFLLDNPSPELIEQLTERKESLFRSLLPGKVQALPGVRSFIQELHDKGIPMAVASSTPMENITAILGELGIRGFFNEIVSGALMPGKPDPAVFLEAARRLGVPPARCLVIEDAIVGVQGAKRAGMLCLAVTTTNPPEALQEADWVVEGVEGLNLQPLRI